MMCLLSLLSLLSPFDISKITSPTNIRAIIKLSECDFCFRSSTIFSKFVEFFDTFLRNISIESLQKHAWQCVYGGSYTLICQQLCEGGSTDNNTDAAYGQLIWVSVFGRPLELSDASRWLHEIDSSLRLERVILDGTMI